MKIIKQPYLFRLLSIIFKEKYIFIIIFASIFLAYSFVGGKYTGEAVKGRFSIKVATFFTNDAEGMLMKQIESNEVLISYLKSFEFFSSINKNCTLSVDDLAQRNYVVRKNEFYVDVILRFSERKKILTCLDAIRENVHARHEALFKTYIDTINYQIDNLRIIFKKNMSELSDLYRQNSILNLQNTLTPMILNRNTLLQSITSTKFLNQRTYSEESVYYSNSLVGLVISIIMSLSIFIIYIFIKHSKKLNF